ncbi:MAG: hypothetical protein JXR94_03595, partial [Candidatus Hydrogenedentes bacterium]|nr:hypothetical protein [Candidatus Hydrogenedentota bacterium]
TALDHPAGLPLTVEPGGDGSAAMLALRPAAIPALHSALVFECRYAGRVRVTPEFYEPDLRWFEYGTAVELEGNPENPESIEIPMPDFTQVQLVFRIEFLSDDARFTLTQTNVLSDLADEDRLISVISWAPDCVELTVDELDGPRILVFLDAAYPGWRAEVDGVPAEVFLADDAFKAVALLPGTHTVRFAFNSARVWAGVGVSVGALAAALAVAAWGAGTRGARAPG